MKRLFTLLLCYCMTVAVFAQQYWSDVTVSNFASSNTSVMPEHVRTVHLQFTDWQKQLTTAPPSFSGQQGVAITLPLPSGQSANFYATAAKVFDDRLAAKYPQIRAYRIVGVENPNMTGYLDVNSHSLHAVIHSDAGEIYIDPLDNGEPNTYQAYYTKDRTPSDTYQAPLSCGYHAHSKESPVSHEPTTTITPASKSKAATIQLRSYRMAISATAAFSRRFGNTNQSVMETFNTALTRMNEIFEREIAVTFTLVAESEDLIFLNSNSEPWNNPTLGADLLGQSQIVFNNLIAPTLYDIGHVFTGNCSDVGGIASLAQVCSGNKMRGVTCFGGNLDVDVVRILSHEVGHQFGATHTMNQCDGNEENVSSQSAYEPGSGSTIMSYSGVCGAQNVQFGPDEYFHSNSLDQMIRFTRLGTGNDCATIVPINNEEPVATLDYEDGFFIPISTPFQLTGTATDADNDVLFYNWEQFNLGPQTDLGTQRINSPGFRTYLPTNDPTRVFPRIQAVIGNFSEDVELLPDYSRDYTFRFIVRDHNETGGAVVWEEVSFKATEFAGPFLVTTANEADVNWEVGQQQEVTWDVANTNNATVNCQKVNIKLSLDGGFTYPVTLVSDTPNDGTELITVPDAVGDRVRIRVEAADNIFFDISNQDLTIVEPAAPGFALTLTPNNQEVCVPSIVTVDISTAALLGFEDPITLSLGDDIPGDIVATLAETTINPGESTTLTADFSNSDANGLVNIVLNATAGDINTTRTVGFDATNTDFSAVQPQLPEDGVSGVIGAPTFMWSASAFADTYDFEIATSDNFDEGTIVERATELTETSFTIAQPLEEMMTFFWRVRASNKCGTGDWTAPFTLSSISAVCSPLSSPEVPVNLPGAITQVTSSLNVNVSGSISDLQVPVVRGSYGGVNGLRMILRSPAGTEVVLFDRNCGLTNGFNLGFDDEAPSQISCPPTSGNVEQPIESLAAFIGEDTRGEWQLTIDIQDPGFGSGGALQEWQIEFCSIVNTTELGDNDQIVLFPNPTRHSLTLTTEQTFDKDAVISIYNAQGLVVQTQTVATATTDVTLPTNSLPSGIYLLSVLSDDQLFTKQFVKL